VSNQQPVPVVLVLPAMGVDAEYYEPLASSLASATGAIVRRIPLRSQGNARLGDRYGYREIVEDVVVEVLRQRVAHRSSRIFLLGHSLGGQLAVLASAALQGELGGLILIAAGTAHHRVWPASQRPRARWTVRCISTITALLPWYPGRWLGFGGNQSRRLMRDWAYNANTGRYRYDGQEPGAIERCLRICRMPVLALVLEGDPLAPRGAVEELLGKLPFAAIERRTISGALEDTPWRRHFTWARKPQEVVACIAGWLSRGMSLDEVA
jgi:predicted alpha/beta hydrolase